MSIKDGYLKRFDRLETITNQHAIESATAIRDLRMNNEALHDSMRATVNALQDSSTLGSLENRTSAIQHMLEKIQQKLNAMTESETSEDLGARLSEAVDRLFSIVEAEKGDFDMQSEEAQLVIDDVVIVLKALLQEINPDESRSLYPKRKREPSPQTDARVTNLDIQDRLAIKRMRGMLDSAPSINFRGSSLSILSILLSKAC